MGGGQWVVHEGFVLCKFEDPNGAAGSPTAGALLSPTRMWKPTAAPLVERYIVLSMNRKMELFDSNTPDRKKVDQAYVLGFCGWDGAGLLKADSYGLELKLERHAHASRMYLAAFNRLDLDKWCRGFLAVIDPQSAAGEEVRRDHRKVRREEKRLQQEREEKIRKWKEKKRREMEEEQERLLAREEEINNMTPLERVDGLGSLDDDTARILEKRKLRLQRRQAPTTGRVNKAAYRRRLEEAAGGKLENVQPLQTKIVEQKYRVRVDLPPPGQFIEAARPGRPSPSDRRGRMDSSESNSSFDNRSESSSFSSRHSGGLDFDSAMQPPPPPPPRSTSSVTRSSPSSRNSEYAPPPPPPLHSGFNVMSQPMEGRRLSRSNSMRSSMSGQSLWDRPSESESRLSFSQTRRRPSNLDRNQASIQDSLAAILSGKKAPPSVRNGIASGDYEGSRARGHSFSSVVSDRTTVSTRERKTKTSNGASNNASAPPPMMANAFAASLDAIRRNRADTIESSSALNFGGNGTQENGQPKARNRKRESQLSAEGKELLQKAMLGEDEAPARAPKSTGRKGLFDDSSSGESDDDDDGLFGMSKKTSNGAAASSNGSDKQRQPMKSAARTSSFRNGNGHAFDDNDSSDSDSDSDHDQKSSMFTSMSKPKPTTPSTSGSRVSSAAPQQSAPATALTVIHLSSIVKSDGKKNVGVFTFGFRMGTVEHQITHSYHELAAIHERLAPELPANAQPKFPSKHLLRNNTKPENLQKRADEFVQYFRQLLAFPNILSNQRFLFEFQIGDTFARASNASPPTQEHANRMSPSITETERSAFASPVQKPRRNSMMKANKPTKANAKLFSAEDSDSDSDSDASVKTSHSTRSKRGAISGPKEEPKRMMAFQPEQRYQEEDYRKIRPSSKAIEKKKTRAPSAASVRSEAPISAPAAVAPPPPAGRPPNPFGGAGRGNLLAAIRQGKELRKVDDDGPAVPVAGRGAGVVSSALKPGPAAPPQPAAPAGSINEAITNAMAARRIHIEYEATSDAEDSDDDWD